MTSLYFQNLEDTTNLMIEEFCKKLSVQYNLDEKEVYSLWTEKKVKDSKVSIDEEKPKKSSSKPADKKTEPEIKNNEEKPKKSSSKPADKEEKTIPISGEKSSEITSEHISNPKTTRDMLVAMCKAKGIKQSGKKNELVARLLESISSSNINNDVVDPIKVTVPKGTEKSVIKTIKPSSLTIRKNSAGNFEHFETHLVFGLDKIVYGTQTDIGVVDLTDSDIENCRKFKFTYKIPENLNNSKSLNDIKVEEIDDEEVDDEDIEEVEEDVDEEETIEEDQ